VNVVVYISGHGLGHLAQTAPAIGALHARLDDFNLTLRTEIPESLLKRRLNIPFEIKSDPVDVGFVMANALDIDRSATRQAYDEFHTDFALGISREARWLDDNRTDLVITNISHLGAAAAHAVEVKSVGLCSLNWADLYLDYFGRDEIYSRMRDAYATLDRFCCPTPSMTMPSLANRVSIGCIAVTGSERRRELNATLGLADDTTLGLVTPGGLDFDIDPTRWRVPEGFYWIMPGRQAASGRMCGIDRIDVGFLDLLASVDVVVGKPGYGMVTECVAAAKPMLYVRRNDWPEQDSLLQWLHDHARAKSITREMLQNGNIIDAVNDVMDEPAPPRVQISGAEDFAESVLNLF